MLCTRHTRLQRPALRSLCPDTARTLPGLPVVWLRLTPCCRGPRSLFADPFAGFNGVERFKRNVSNLGGLMCGPARPVSSRPPLHAPLPTVACATGLW